MQGLAHINVSFLPSLSLCSGHPAFSMLSVCPTEHLRLSWLLRTTEISHKQGFVILAYAKSL